MLRPWTCERLSKAQGLITISLMTLHYSQVTVSIQLRAKASLVKSSANQRPSFLH